MADRVLIEIEVAAMEMRADRSLKKLGREDFDTWVEVQAPTHDVPILCASHRLLQKRVEGAGEVVLALQKQVMELEKNQRPKHPVIHD